MEVNVTLSTTLEFESLTEYEDAINIVCGDMTPEEIVDLAQHQGNTIKVDVN